jgi:cystathionine gamma-synthase
VPSPFDCWLVLRGLRTLAIRMDRACANAAIVAEWLATRPEVSAVHYPGLANHPQRELAERQMRQPGAMLSFQLHGGADAARRVANATRLFTLAESLGAVESLIEVPAVMTHASVAGSSLEVPADLVRLSIGIESADDLVADLEQALASASA